MASARTRTVPLADPGLVDHRVKGVPGGTPPFHIDDVRDQRWNLLREDLPLPQAVLRESALQHNSRWMRAFLEGTEVEIAPHGKTTLSPELFRRQIDDGAWAITVATVHQLQLCREHRIGRVLLANQLVGKPEISYVLDELRRDPAFDFYCLVDSVRGVELLAAAARAHPVARPLQVLLEVGYAGGRAGCRTAAEALDVARAVRESAPHLVLRGVEGFEGLVSGDSVRQVEGKVDAFLDFLTDVAEACDAEGLFPIGPVILTAGGSAFFDMVPERLARTGLGSRATIVIRSGCYLTHDSRMYREAHSRMLERSPRLAELGAGLRPALEVWGYVQSRPEPELAILTLGRRDCGSDAGHPAPFAWFRPAVHTVPMALGQGYLVENMNDQHAFLRVPRESELEVGDMVASGISHPCTTFDKWKLIFVVSDDYEVVSAVRTFF